MVGGRKRQSCEPKTTHHDDKPFCLKAIHSVDADLADSVPSAVVSTMTVVKGTIRDIRSQDRGIIASARRPDVTTVE